MKIIHRFSLLSTLGHCFNVCADCILSLELSFIVYYAVYLATGLFPSNTTGFCRPATRLCLVVPH